MDTALFNLLSFFSILLGFTTAAAALWFVYAVGLPLRRWLERELANEPARNI